MAIIIIKIWLPVKQIQAAMFPLPCSRVPPVKLEHEACDDHATRDLEGHPPNDVHLLPSVRVEGWVIQLLGIEQLLHLGAWGHNPHPAIQRQKAELPPRPQSSALTFPSFLRSLPMPSSSVSTSSLGDLSVSPPAPSPNHLPALLHHHLGPVQLLLWYQDSAGVCDIEEVLHPPQESALVPTGGIDVKARQVSLHLAHT